MLLSVARHFSKVRYEVFADLSKKLWKLVAYLNTSNQNNTCDKIFYALLSSFTEWL